MANVSVEYEDQETVAIRIADNGYFGLAAADFDTEFEDRGLSGGTATVVELSIRPTVARALFLALAETLTEE